MNHIKWPRDMTVSGAFLRDAPVFVCSEYLNSKISMGTLDRLIVYVAADQKGYYNCNAAAPLFFRKKYIFCDRGNLFIF